MSDVKFTNIKLSITTRAMKRSNNTIVNTELPEFLNSESVQRQHSTLRIYTKVICIFNSGWCRKIIYQSPKNNCIFSVSPLLLTHSSCDQKAKYLNCIGWLVIKHLLISGSWDVLLSHWDRKCSPDTAASSSISIAPRFYF